MDVVYPVRVNTTAMATNIVKWWKSKFLNGYRQFAVECGDGKVSDTEELLGRLGSESDTNERLRAACTTPPLQPQARSPTPEDRSTPRQQTPQHHLNFEEFSCDVAVENDDKSGPERRQEFSFTLYDFDGHGKITKDDIAGLVTTIYEVLGSSVRVPHYGSKTIQVKLTVSPDQSLSATIVNNQKDQTDNKQETKMRYKKDLNVTISQNNGEKQRHCKRSNNKRQNNNSRKHHCCGKRDDEQEQNDQQHFVSDHSSEVYSRISGHISTDEDEVDKPMRKHHHKNGYTIPNLFIRDTNLCMEGGCVNVKTPKKRSGSLQRQELLEIIQANMDKNNLSFQTARKHSSYAGSDSKRFLEHYHKHHSRQKMAQLPLQYLANIVDPTHFYVDLASLQNTTHLPQTNCQYDKLIDAVMCVSNKKVAVDTTKLKCRDNECNRNGTNETNNIPLQYLQNDGNKLNKGQKRVSKKTQRGPQVANGHTSSPHHLRHRNRQEDQARAMAQVVRWLEQEFSNNLNTSEKQEKTNNNNNNKTNNNNNNNNNVNNNNNSNKENNGNNKNSCGSAGVERHEHHHIHEHIHHHYHHYQETPLVV